MHIITSSDLNFVQKNKYFPFPKIMQIEVITDCPLHCPQCYKEDSEVSIMGLDQFSKIIDDAKRVGVGAITLLGGEPLIHPNICEMIHILDDAGIIGGTYISGIGINESFVTTLKSLKNRFYLFLSLNGSTKRIHELSRDRFDVSLRAMQSLKEEQIDYIVNWVARHDNISDLKALIKLSRENGAKYLNVVCNKINGRGEVESPMEYEDYNILKDLFMLPENKDFLKMQNCYGLLKSYLNISENSIFSGCQAGVTVCAVDVKGKYRPCLHLNYPEDHSSIMDYWENSVVLEKLRDNYRKTYEGCDNCKPKSREIYTQNAVT